MVRLDVLVADVLANARRAMDEGKAGRADIKAARTSELAAGGMPLGKGLGCDRGAATHVALHQRGRPTRDTRRPSGGLE